MLLLVVLVVVLVAATAQTGELLTNVIVIFAHAWLFALLGGTESTGRTEGPMYPSLSRIQQPFQFQAVQLDLANVTAILQLLLHSGAMGHAS